MRNTDRETQGQYAAVIAVYAFGFLWGYLGGGPTSSQPVNGLIVMIAVVTIGIKLMDAAAFVLTLINERRNSA